MKCTQVPVLCCILSLVILGPAESPAQETIYVDQAAAGADDGSSWADAYTDLQSAFDHAAASKGQVKEIRVAQGTYRPTRRTDPADPRSATFMLVDGVALRAQHAGEADAGPDGCAASLLAPVLSGDLAGNDPAFGFANTEENAYRVLTAENLANTVVIEGFTIRGGAAETSGGGLYVADSPLSVRQCLFIFNQSLSRLPFASSSPTAQVLHGYGGGGGMHAIAWNATVHAIVERSSFCHNKALSGGGGLLTARISLDLIDSYFTGNAAEKGGAVAMFYLTSANLEGCSFDRNSADEGGGVLAHYFDGPLAVAGCSFRHCEAAVRCGAVDWYGGADLSVVHSNFYQNEGGVCGSIGRNVTLSDVQFSYNFNGAASFQRADRLTVSGCLFEHNWAIPGGGAGLAISSIGMTTVERTSFVDNWAEYGGGMAGEGYVTIANSVFEENMALQHGGGAALRAFNGVVRSSRFLRNRAGARGGGLHLSGHGDFVTDSEFYGNSALIGGGLYGDELTGRIENCFMSGNSASDGGGFAGKFYDSALAGLFVFENYAQTGGGGSIGGTVDVVNSVFGWNSAGVAGGILTNDGDVTIRNCTIVSNTAGLGAGLLAVIGTGISNNIVWGNYIEAPEQTYNDEWAQIEGLEVLHIDHSIVENWTGRMHGVATTADDPQFLSETDPDGQYGPLLSDFRLLTQSPAIDSGDPEYVGEPGETDLDGKPRVLCGRVDRGAYEYGVVGDIDCDRAVTLLDFREWASCETGPGEPISLGDCQALDFHTHGLIDLHDFAGFQLDLGE